MIRMSRSILLVAVLPVLASGCGATPEDAGGTRTGASGGPPAATDEPPETADISAEFPVTVERCGHQLTVEAPPKRVLATDWANVEVLVALGLSERIVGWASLHTPDPLPEQAASWSELDQIAGSVPSREVMLDTEPEFMVANIVYGDFDRDELETFGIDLFQRRTHCGDGTPDQIDAIVADIADLGAIFGVDERADELISELTAELQSIEACMADTEAVRAMGYYFHQGEERTAVGEHSVMADAMRRVGGTNVFSDVDRSWERISTEVLLERDPEVILVTDHAGTSLEEHMASLTADPALATLQAVRNDRVEHFSVALAGTGVRFPQAARVIAEVLHGEECP